MKIDLVWSALLVGWAVLGCNSDRKQPTPGVPPSAIGSVATDEPRAARPEPYADIALPDEADFADEVDKEITVDNYAARLGELEKEIAEAEAEADAGRRGGVDAGSSPPASSASASAKDRAADGGATKEAPPGKSREPTDGTHQ